MVEGSQKVAFGLEAGLMIFSVIAIILIRIDQLVRTFLNKESGGK